MQKEFIEQITNLSKNSITPFVAFNKIASRAFEKMAKANLEILNDAITTGVSNLQEISGAKRVEDVVALQAKILKDSGAKAIKYTQNSLETLVDTSSEFSKWFEEGVSSLLAAANEKKVGAAAGTGKI